MKTVIIIKGLIAGLNGSNGLMQEHYSKGIKKKKKYQALIRAQTNNRHKGQVSITYIGYKSVLMDWDNFAASLSTWGIRWLKQRLF